MKTLASKIKRINEPRLSRVKGRSPWERYRFVKGYSPEELTAIC